MRRWRSVWRLSCKLACAGLLLAHALASAAEASKCPPPLPVASGTVPARDRGLLWRVTKDGRSSYLFGTLHVGKPAWRRFGPHVSAALKASDILALEIDPNDPDLLKAMAELRPPQELPPALQQRLMRAFERACVAADSMATLHQLLQATSLTVLEARWFGLDPGHALEQALSTQARATGRRIVSLETAAQQAAALVPEDETEARALLEQSLQQLEDHSARRVLARLAAAWEQGDITTLEDYDKWCECVSSEADRAALRQLNDERNPTLADGIEAQHRRGLRVFAAVGALHMTGAKSLPALMAQRGFQVERIGFSR